MEKRCGTVAKATAHGMMKYAQKEYRAQLAWNGHFFMVFIGASTLPPSVPAMMARVSPSSIPDGRRFRTETRTCLFFGMVALKPRGVKGFGPRVSRLKQA